jgi:hypothetical protein
MYNKPLSAGKYLGQDLGRCTHPGEVLHKGGISSFLEQKQKENYKMQDRKHLKKKHR